MRIPSVVKVILLIVALVTVGLGGIFLVSFNEARQASFNLDVLERYLQAYLLVTGERPQTLADIPDFHIISTYDSLSLRSRDIRRGVYKGYRYDYHPFKDGRFMILASPVGMFAPHIVFGVTEQGGVHEDLHPVNAKEVSYDEINSWPRIHYRERIRTAKLPSYIRKN